MHAHLESVNCGNCGAPLRIPETVQFVTCNHCKSSLAVKRMDSITLTEKLEQTHERLEETERRLAQLVYQNELAEEHRRWDREERGLLETDEHGNHRPPTHIPVGCAAVVAVFAAWFFWSFTFIGFFRWIPLAIGIVAFFALVAQNDQYRKYEDARKKHQQRLQNIHERYRREQQSGSHADFLKQLESAPTPEDYLRELSRS